jgi:hypothetical protein
MIDQPEGERPEGGKPIGEMPIGEKPIGEKPALTVVIQSWWTPALTVIALVAGLLVGYFGRPLISNSSPGGVANIVAPNPTATTAVPTPTVDPTQVQQVMDSIVAKTTNFMGDPNATVTLIEFSDYQ